MKELFIEKGWGDAGFLQDIAMENKGMEYSMYISKESLAQQGGYAMTNKGPSTTRPGLFLWIWSTTRFPRLKTKPRRCIIFPCSERGLVWRFL